MLEAAAASEEGRAVASRYRLHLDRRRFRGHLGGQRGRGAGASQEFLDFRDYTPGDDVRHIDWQGFARSEQLRVRLFEAEVAPHVDLVVDTSPSMVVTPRKAAAAHSLWLALRQWAHSDGARLRTLTLGGEQADEEPAWGSGPVAPAVPMAPLRRDGLRVLLTDGLWRESPTALLHTLAAGAAHFVCVQLLDPWELAPTIGDVVTLFDCETGERHERRLDRRTVAAYQERLQRLCDEVRTTVLATGGIYVRTVADSLATMCERDLVPASVLEPA